MNSKISLFAKFKEKQDIYIALEYFPQTAY